VTACAPALELVELTIHYGRRIAVDRMSLTVASGEVVGLLGPNGAGKSTTLLAAAGAILPSAGAIRVCGHDLRAQRMEASAHTGFADQPPSMYEFLTVVEHLGFLAEVRGTEVGRIEPLLADLGLGGIRDRLCRELSFGMRQRVGLAAALLGDMRLVLLDETLNGLDPHASRRAGRAVEDAAARGVAIVMSTHLLEMTARLCRRVVVMDKGRIVADVADTALTPGKLEELYLSAVADEAAE
jgi:ABC-2 type transport system ATP-binding protein